MFAGDIIDAFGQKWIVTEARADSTTHKTGIMRQCNKLFRFQNFTPEIIERWGCIDMSGYSSSINKDSQVQHVSEQLAIYLPYDALRRFTLTNVFRLISGMISLEKEFCFRLRLLA